MKNISTVWLKKYPIWSNDIHGSNVKLNRKPMLRLCVVVICLFVLSSLCFVEIPVLNANSIDHD